MEMADDQVREIMAAIQGIDLKLAKMEPTLERVNSLLDSICPACQSRIVVLETKNAMLLKILGAIGILVLGIIGKLLFG